MSTTASADDQPDGGDPDPEPLHPEPIPIQSVRQQQADQAHRVRGPRAHRRRWVPVRHALQQVRHSHYLSFPLITTQFVKIINQ